MIRVLVVLVALTTIASADTASEERAITEQALARFDHMDRGVFAKLWDLVDDSHWNNVKHAKENFLEAKAAVDKELAANEEVEAQLKLQDLKREAASFDSEIATYERETKSTVWKLQAGIGIFVAGLVIMTIVGLVRRRRR